MIGRPKVPLVLTTPEQQALDSLAHRARTAPQVARRARIVLACARKSSVSYARCEPL